MMKTILRGEHEDLGFDCIAGHGLTLERLLDRINYNSNRIVSGRVNMLQFNMSAGKPRLESFFRIGAEWLDDDVALVVLPKMKDIDYMSMFMTCLRSPVCQRTFGNIYNIDSDAKPIESEVLDSVLSPLLVVHFLNCVDRIASRGLKKGYVSRSGNLKKVKGRLNIRKNERMNIRSGHSERVYCDYQEFSVDIPENRVLKKALCFARAMLDGMAGHPLQPQLCAMLNRSLSAFDAVRDEIEPWQIATVKVNKLYRGYEEAIRLAGLLLRRCGYSIRRASRARKHVPPFCIDMSLLFEHYVLGLLDQAYGDAVRYQARGYRGRFIADFLFDDGTDRAVIDTKYMPRLSDNDIDGDIVKQLGGYARSISLLRKMGMDVTETDAVPDIPCVVIFPPDTPTVTPVTNPFMGKSLSSFLDCPQKGIVRLYKVPVAIPSIKTITL
ncbi:MAG: TonB-dependent receptor [Bacteroidales bacterium]|nr:TonB-dependent receptor [Bacteroidales bacterium]